MGKVEENNKKNGKVSFRQWILFILIGFAGQLAWNVENMYLNKFIFSFGDQNYSLMITLTVAISAIVACLTTIFMGALSDKIGKRKIFIALGYLLWGISTASFGFISVENVSILFPSLSAASVAAILVIIMDAIMTFIGSSANDAAFNAYVTENVDDKNRGKVEGVLSILPLIAMLVIFIGLDTLTTSGHWDLFFFIIGGFAFIVGIISFFLIPKEEKRNNIGKRTYIKTIAEGFRIKTIKNNKSLYIILIAYLIFGIATQIFFPYLMIYFQYTLNFQGLDFMICLGVVLILGSLLTVLAGIMMDKFGKNKLIIPIMILAILGLFLVYFVKPGELIFAIIAGTVMLFGYICGGSVLNAIVREKIPEGDEGIFMGVRMIFVVMLPMVSGPYIAQVLVDNFANGTYIGDYGTPQNLPPALIWLVSAIVLIFIFIPIYFYLKKEKNDKKKKEKENFGKVNNGISYKIEKENHDENFIPLKEHPNPYFKRNNYLSLNGYWDLYIGKEESFPSFYNKKILVPYAIESPLSEVEVNVLPDDVIFYHKEIILPLEMYGEHLIINFLGVDQTCELYVNKMLVMKNESGYNSFSYDIRPLIKEDRKLEIILKVKDVSDTSYFSRGKQSLNRGNIWYTTTSGIYKPVYLESVSSKEYIKSFNIIPDVNEETIKGIIETNSGYTCLLKVGEEEFLVEPNKPFSLKIKNIHYWNLDDPYLYGVKIKYYDDEISSVLGFRKIEIKKKNNKNRLFLNNKEIILKGLLDQGYYFKGNLTPEKYEDYYEEIKKIKSLGFNTLRKHIKLEIPLFYYYCDKLGVFTIQDIVNGGRSYDKWTIQSPLILNTHKKDIDKDYKKFKREDEKGREEYLTDLNFTLSLLSSSPSNIIICLFNEGWGQFDSTIYYKHTKNIVKNNKLIDTASGWYDNENSDFYSKHVYFLPIKNIKMKGKRAYLLSEFGGYSLYLKDHFYGKSPYGYKKFKDSKSLTKAYERLMISVIKSLKKDMVGFIYTQLSDVEDEVNGLFTFDRKILKIDENTIKNINKKVDELTK